MQNRNQGNAHFLQAGPKIWTHRRDCRGMFSPINPWSLGAYFLHHHPAEMLCKRGVAFLEKDETEPFMSFETLKKFRQVLGAAVQQLNDGWNDSARLQLLRIQQLPVFSRVVVLLPCVAYKVLQSWTGLPLNPRPSKPTTQPQNPKPYTPNPKP